MRIRRQSNQMGCFGTIIFTLIFGGVGIGLLVWGVISYRTALESRNWPTTEGIVTFSEVYTSTDSDGTTYGATVNYRYTVNDQSYNGDKVSLTDYSSSSRGRAEDIVERYEEEDIVTVYYDPYDPSKAVLETGANWVQYLLMGMGCCFSIVPLFGLLSFIRGRGM